MRLLRIKEKSDLRTDLVDLLLKNLEIRKRDLLKHPTMLCAIYLDHRMYQELSDKEIQIAKMTLANIHQKIRNLTQNTGEEHAEGDSSFNDSLDEYFKRSKKNQSDKQTHFMQLLDTFHLSLQYEKQENHKSTSIDFWENKKSAYPALYEIACVINSIPPSQATVERGFSILKFVFGEKRTRIVQDSLENILLIKLNAELSHSIFRNQVSAIERKYTV